MAGAAAVAEPRSGLDRRTDLHSSGAARATDRALCTPSARSGGGALVAVDPATNELRAEYNPGRRGEPSLVVRARAFECEEWGADTVGATGKVSSRPCCVVRESHRTLSTPACLPSWRVSVQPVPMGLSVSNPGYSNLVPLNFSAGDPREGTWLQGHATLSHRA